VTGTACAYDCGHCGGRYLEGMADVSAPGELARRAEELEAAGGIGFLLSGGCSAGGSVDFSSHLEEIAGVKRRTGLVVNAHTGLMDPAGAQALRRAGVDAVSVDVVGSRETVREVYGFDAGPEDYARTLEALSSAGDWSIVPHICLGLGSDDEREALELVAAAPAVNALVIISLIPTKGTAMEGRPPVAPERLAGFVADAKAALAAPVVLGCMRPRAGTREEERMALDAGADGIVLPSRETVSYVREKGWRVEEYPGCCAFVPSLITGGTRGTPP